MPKGYIPAPRLRHTEEIARETLAGLCGQLLTLSRSDDPKAWGQIAMIARELISLGDITEDALIRRHDAPMGTFDAPITRDAEPYTPPYTPGHVYREPITGAEVREARLGVI